MNWKIATFWNEDDATINEFFKTIGDARIRQIIRNAWFNPEMREVCDSVTIVYEE